MNRPRAHRYDVRLSWTGNLGRGTADYGAYSRNHLLRVEGKSALLASSDPLFRGDRERYTPEELLVGSLSGCHMLWYLHLCADAGITVIDYQDDASGTMVEDAEGAGRFVEVCLAPRVTIRPGSDEALALTLHRSAGQKCFIANSVNFPVSCRPVIVLDQGPPAIPIAPVQEL